MDFLWISRYSPLSRRGNPEALCKVNFWSTYLAKKTKKTRTTVTDHFCEKFRTVHFSCSRAALAAAASATAGRGTSIESLWHWPELDSQGT